MSMIGHETMGSGPMGVLILNDWIGCTSTWDGARGYLDGERFTWAFADVRGYGRSKGRTGTFTLGEVAADALQVADALGFQRFAIVGHSMTSLVALHLGQHFPERIERVVALTPPPPRGFGVDDARLASMEAVGRGDDARRTAALKVMLGDRLSERWLRLKVERWRAAADPEAVAGYVRIFARAGLPDPTAPIAAPVLAVTGERDSEIMRGESVKRLLAPLAAQLTVVSIADSAHYPMQETPPLLAAILQRFLAGSPEPS